ncbi:uncharacterized protein LOC117180860 [Belonocnema kinseyi]|uniref:uncharacterized protein LOC117180860 n=1 Tax=Belonocnema kinseyi TaxID=2817044 RepID=UPI00143D9EC7|nr:uncharacterized protein LOC117180860 [Belonocnema kinseyi]
MLAKLMPNVAGPSNSKRNILMSVAHSIMLYGAEVWAEAVWVKKYRAKLASIKRKGAIGVGCVYRTVSEAAILVLAVTLPIDFLATERKRVFEARENREERETLQIERIRTLFIWGDKWTNEEKVTWTARFI